MFEAKERADAEAVAARCNAAAAVAAAAADRGLVNEGEHGQ